MRKSQNIILVKTEVAREQWQTRLLQCRKMVTISYF